MESETTYNEEEKVGKEPIDKSKIKWRSFGRKGHWARDGERKNTPPSGNDNHWHVVELGVDRISLVLNENNYSTWNFVAKTMYGARGL